MSCNDGHLNSYNWFCPPKTYQLTEETVQPTVCKPQGICTAWRHRCLTRTCHCQGRWPQPAHCWDLRVTSGFICRTQWPGAEVPLSFLPSSPSPSPGGTLLPQKGGPHCSVNGRKWLFLAYNSLFFTHEEGAWTVGALAMWRYAWKLPSVKEKWLIELPVLLSRKIIQPPLKHLMRHSISKYKERWGLPGTENKKCHFCDRIIWKPK